MLQHLLRFLSASTPYPRNDLRLIKPLDRHSCRHFGTCRSFFVLGPDIKFYSPISFHDLPWCSSCTLPNRLEMLFKLWCARFQKIGRLAIRLGSYLQRPLTCVVWIGQMFQTFQLGILTFAQAIHFVPVLKIEHEGFTQWCHRWDLLVSEPVLSLSNRRTQRGRRMIQKPRWVASIGRYP